MDNCRIIADNCRYYDYIEIPFISLPTSYMTLAFGLEKNPEGADLGQKV
jgi:hypothetical protein